MFYDELKANLIPTLTELVKYLTGETIPKNVSECILENSEGVFYRKKTTTAFDPYSVIPHEDDALLTMKEELFHEIGNCIKVKKCVSSTTQVQNH